MGIVRFALRFPHTFYVLAALIVFLGVTAIRTMPTDIFPQINIPVVTIIWSYTGLSTPEMEQRVSTYSQYSISSNVNGIKDMESQTLNGISVQKIYFQPDVNLDLAIAQIVSATNAIRALMPPGIQPPIIVQFNASSVPVLQLTLTSNNLNEQQLYDYGIYRLRQQLAPVPGVTFPTPAGGKYRQIMQDNVIRTLVYVPQDQAFGLEPGVYAVVHVPEIPDRGFPGKVARIADALQPGTRTLLTEVDVPNPDGALDPGIYVTVELHIPRKVPSFIVPAGAIIFNADGLHVAVVENGAVHFRKVTVARDLGTTVEVHAALCRGTGRAPLDPAAEGRGVLHRSR